MHIRLTETSPGSGPGVRIAFLHEGRDPSSNAPKPVRASLKSAIREAGFRAKEREIAWSGGWMLCGLGKAPATVARLAHGTAPGRARHEAPRPGADRALLRRRGFRDGVPSPSAADRPGGLRLRALQVTPGEPAPPRRAGRRHAASRTPGAISGRRGAGSRGDRRGRRLGAGRRKHAGQRPRAAGARPRGQGPGRPARFPAPGPQPEGNREREDGQACSASTPEAPALRSSWWPSTPRRSRGEPWSSSERASRSTPGASHSSPRPRWER